MSRVSNSELGLLYRRALATLQPSWEEGFGLPMLESMAHGCPLITSNCSASAEIAGDGAILVDPGTPGKSREVLETLLADRSVRRNWAEKGRRRSLQFTWDAYFRGLLDLYRGPS
jgi:glycosyltransferase involved in cell wall biosynthesis